MMFSNCPLVSIVTPSYNQAQFLEETIVSVLNQDYPNIEYIIVDGGSTDGSVDIIRKYGSQLAYWVSEPDRGQAHAINKGWSRARGDIVAYLNSDDVYAPEAITKAVQALVSNPESGMVYSDAFVVGEYDDALQRYRALPFDIKRTIITNEGWIPQPTAFIRRSALDAVGLLDERLHLVMDYDLFIRLGLAYPMKYLPDTYLAIVREHQNAKSTQFVDRFPVERRRVLNKIFARLDLAPHVQEVRGEAYAYLAFIQAVNAANVDQPDRILGPLVRAVLESPAYLTRTPLDFLYLLTRSLVPCWKGKLSFSFSTGSSS